VHDEALEWYPRMDVPVEVEGRSAIEAALESACRRAGVRAGPLEFVRVRGSGETALAVADLKEAPAMERRDPAARLGPALGRWCIARPENRRPLAPARSWAGTAAAGQCEGAGGGDDAAVRQACRWAALWDKRPRGRGARSASDERITAAAVAARMPAWRAGAIG
jgi:hypothetical protein